MKLLKKLIRSILKSRGLTVVPVSAAEDSMPEYTAQQKIAGKNCKVIFDAGAHHGQTALTYYALFPDAEIFSFEPFPASYEQLKANTAAHSQLKAYNLALGNASGYATFHVNASSQTNSLLQTDEGGAATWGENLLNTVQTISVEAITIDDFVNREQVACIDILKLDTQGTEYQIIEGAAQTIAANKIKLIYTEIITMPTYEGQKSFDEVLQLLRNKGFSLYNLYNFSHTPAGKLRQVDAIFIHKSFHE
jgi:FkbM family methyltransferase